MWQAMRLLGVRVSSASRSLGQRLIARSMSAEATGNLETSELPALVSGESVIGPSVFETPVSTAGYPVLPVAQLREMASRMTTVLPRQSQTPQSLPPCILWRLRHNVAPARGPVYFVPAEHLQLVRWMSPQEMAEGIASSTPRP